MSENYEDYKDNVIDAEYRDVTNEKNGKNKKKKSSGGAKKVFTAIGLAIIFGLVASITFNASNMIVNKINKSNEPVAEVPADNKEAKVEEKKEEQKATPATKEKE